MSPKSKKPKPIDIYVRVSLSRVAGREGESYLSPHLQEERCRAMITVAGAEVGQVFVDEDVVSGRKTSRPAFNQAMQRVRDGQSGSISVWRLSRFGRSTQGVLRGVQELGKHGAVLISTSEALDTSTSVGRFVLTIFAALTELESEQIRESWDATHDSMISRGIHSGAPVPVGYRKGEDKRLVPNKDAKYVREVFRMRAEDGTSWREIARYLTERGVPTISGGRWSPSSARTVIRNRLYLGEARHGNRVKVDAHPRGRAHLPAGESPTSEHDRPADRVPPGWLHRAMLRRRRGDGAGESIRPTAGGMSSCVDAADLHRLVGP